MDFLLTINGWFRNDNDRLKVRALKARADYQKSGSSDFMGDLFEMFPELEEKYTHSKIYNVCKAKQANLEITEKLEILAAHKLENCAA